MNMNKVPGKSMGTMKCVLSGNFKEREKKSLLPYYIQGNNEQSCGAFQCI